MRQLLFDSDRFRPYLPDECQVNPNVLGFELADWLSRELAGAGLVTSYPSLEDWGWYLEREEEGAEYMICCSGGAEGSRFEWRIFVTRVKGLFQRASHDARCDELLDAAKKVIEAAGIETTCEGEA